MTFQPFRAIRYSEGIDLSRVTCPPYDVISSSMRQALELLHPENFVRITLPSDPDDSGTATKYDVAAEYLDTWLNAGVLIEEAEESLFLYRCDFVRSRRATASVGILGALKLEPLGGAVHPHETTMPEPKADRLALMRTTSANLEPIWFVAARPSPSIEKIVETYERESPVADLEDAQSVRHRLWRLSSGDATSMREWIEDSDLVIADGHHRYETALAYARERDESDGPGGWDSTLALVANRREFAPTLLPIHRVARGGDLAGHVEKHFSSESTKFDDSAEVLAEVVSASRDLVGLVTAEGSWALKVSSQTPMSDRLPTRFVERLAADARSLLDYEHDLKRALEAVDRETSVFVIPPVELDLVMSEALSGRAMPPKSTLFWPKPVSGMLIRRLQ